MPENLNSCRKTIGWADYTWNPVTGCEHVCKYCYAWKFARRFGKTEDEKNFKPIFHSERIKAKFPNKPSRIFICSNADLFGNWVPAEWIESILKICADNPRHRFLLLTKNPKKYAEFLFTNNCVLGITITSYDDTQLIKRIPDEYFGRKITFISFEPLLGEIWNWQSFNFRLFNWFIIGAQTPYSAKTAPKPEWVQAIIDFAREWKIPIYLKDNLRWPEVIKEFPKGLKI